MEHQREERSGGAGLRQVRAGPAEVHLLHPDKANMAASIKNALFYFSGSFILQRNLLERKLKQRGQRAASVNFSTGSVVRFNPLDGRSRSEEAVLLLF